MLSSAFGNLLPFSQSVNSVLQNDSFEDKKHSKTTGRRGYENASHSESEVSKLQEWTAFVEYAEEKCRTVDIAKQKAVERTYYDVHIGANGYHLFFSIPYGNRIKMGIYTYNVETYNRLKELKGQIKSEFGEGLNWEYSKPTGITRSVVIKENADVFYPSE